VRLGLRFLVCCSAALCLWIWLVVPRLVAAPPRVPPVDMPADATWPMATTAVTDRELERLRDENQRLKLRNRSLRRTLAHSSTVAEALNLACTVYGNCSTLWRKARCESHLYRYAQNRSSEASGLFQFLPSTWATTPFARFSIFSPYANALAAGWMHAQGRGGEWVCR
jgi:hypothetical protein